jgi:hypothetical protein
LGILSIVPVCLSVAIRGRPPKWWSLIEDTLDFQKALNRYIERRDRR